jgi:DinB superfamily
MTSSADVIAAVQQAGEEFAAFVETLSDEQFQRRPAPDEWSAAEITGHVSEVPVTFATHARRVAAEGGGAVGRPPDDPGRLSAVARLAGRGPQEGAQLVREGVREACEILRSIPPEGWQTKGQSPRLGEVTMLAFIRDVAVEHVQGHLRQAQEAAGLV